jgi:hypothetical protein
MDKSYHTAEQDVVLAHVKRTSRSTFIVIVLMLVESLALDAIFTPLARIVEPLLGDVIAIVRGGAAAGVVTDTPDDWGEVLPAVPAGAVGTDFGVSTVGLGTDVGVSTVGLATD